MFLSSIVGQIGITSQIENLESLSSILASKAEELNSNLLKTDDDSIALLREKLLSAVESLNKDIENMKKSAEKANSFLKM